MNLAKWQDKIHTQKSKAVLYTHNELSERKTKKTIPFTIATTTKKVRYLGINLKQGGKRPVLGKLQDTEERNCGGYK